MRQLRFKYTTLHTSASHSMTQSGLEKWERLTMHCLASLNDIINILSSLSKINQLCTWLENFHRHFRTWIFSLNTYIERSILSGIGFEYWLQCKDDDDRYTILRNIVKNIKCWLNNKVPSKVIFLLTLWPGVSCVNSVIY